MWRIILSDLSCGSSAYYSPLPPESLVCSMPEPEPLVCEAPPPIPKPPRDQGLKLKPPGKSQAKVSFIDHDDLVCKEPPKYSHQSQAIDGNQFTAKLAESTLLVSMDLELSDRDGIQQNSQGDIAGTIHQGKLTLNKDSFMPALQSLKGSKQENPSNNTSTLIKDIRFDPKTESYVLALEVTKKILKVPVWDNFEVQFKVNKEGELEAKLDENWMPNDKILSQLEQSIRTTMRQKVPVQAQETLTLKSEQKGNRLILRPQLSKLEVPLGQETSITFDKIDSQKAKLAFDPQGNVQVQFNEVDFQASTALNGPSAIATGQADKARLQIQMALGKDHSRQVHAEGQLELHLDATETPKVKLGQEHLSDFLKSGTLISDFSLLLNQQPGQLPDVKAHSKVEVQNADLGQGKPVDLKTSLQLAFDSENGIRLETLQNRYKPLEIQTSQNGVELFVDGKEYFPQMKNLLANAKQSIDLETFMFTEDDTGKEIADLLAAKAAGLAINNPSTRLDSQTPEGVGVRFIFNSWKGNATDGEASERMLRSASDKIKAQISASTLSPAQKAQAISNLEKNLNWVFFSEGILRSDHRKVLVVDGEQATVGGMNLGAHYLSDNAYHDLTVKMAGPEVRQVQREFLENWYEFRNQPQPISLDDQLKSEEDLQLALEKLQMGGQYRNTAGVQTLVTDDQQVDIERGLVKMINQAQSEINIEQAFFSDETILEHLGEAMQRGVKINVIVAETPLASSVFSAANLLSVYELAKLKKAGAKGDIHLYSYSNPAGGESNHIHAKAVSVDGKRALIGSANMIGRSLGSPFFSKDQSGQIVQTLYNKEMSLLLEDPTFVEELNQRLFQRDQTHFSQELDATAIEAAVEKAGGERELRKKALAAPFT
jgi:phosphatidylserine/phosphatidylglycerophosphate/cardiolipin synthase-like enzyme